MRFPQDGKTVGHSFKKSNSQVTLIEKRERRFLTMPFLQQTSFTNPNEGEGKIKVPDRSKPVERNSTILRRRM